MLQLFWKWYLNLNIGNCINGNCVCNKGWIGEDCSIRDCTDECYKNGSCYIVKPISQCICNEMMKRGGDDCNVIFCINDCGGKGECDFSNGVCKCPDKTYEIDCSIYILPFRNTSYWLQLRIVNILIIFLIIL